MYILVLQCVVQAKKPNLWNHCHRYGYHCFIKPIQVTHYQVGYSQIYVNIFPNINN